MSTLKTGALRGTSGTADSVQLHASDQSVTFPGAVTVTGALTNSGLKVKKYGYNRTTGTSNNTQSESFVALHTQTFTPSSASSKVLVLWSGWVYVDNNNQSVDRSAANLQMTRNHSGISETSIWETSFGQAYPENSGMDFITYGNQSIIFVDEPATTNEVTYTINGKVQATGSSLYIADGSTSRAWTFLELAG